MSAPVIGIVATHSPLHKLNHPDRTVSHISDEVRKALLYNGATPIGILPPGPEVTFANPKSQPYIPTAREAEYIAHQLSLCDGIMFQGGKQTDDFAYYIARLCYDRHIPTLGVCSGQTIMARIFDDTVVEYINHSLHNNPNALYVHETNVDKNSQFYQMVLCEILAVNSRHTRAITACPQLRVAATTEDPLTHFTHIEVLEAPDRFYLSTRFHPESLYWQNTQINAIFKAFVNAAAKYRAIP